MNRLWWMTTHRGARLLLGVLCLLLAAASAEARVGGGQTFSGGQGSSGGGGSGGFGGEAELIFLILELAIRYPKVGIPMLGVFFLFLVGRQYFGDDVQRRVFGRPEPNRVALKARQSATIQGLQKLQRQDKAFSLTVLYEFGILLHRRLTQASSTGEWGPISHLVEASVRAQQQRVHHGTPRGEVVVGSIRLKRVRHQGALTLLDLAFTSTQNIGEPPTRMLVEEVWTLRREADAQSLHPEELLRLGCPACGVSIETTRMGACPNCDSAISAGQLNWQLIQIERRGQRPVEPPSTRSLAGGEEPSVHFPSILQPGLGAQLRSFQARHPDFSMEELSARVQGIYLGIQEAWSRGRWQEARPWVTDSLYQSLRFWIEEYTSHGLRNELRDIRLNRMQVVRVSTDAWYESITLRIWGQMKDTVVDRTGKVVGGDESRDRVFSEYWTFLRASGSGAKAADAHSCPSCGAPLDQISQAGECGYCGSVITTGRFDWVLTRIEQAEVYLGA